jgi:hypothetical protein
MPRRGIAWGHRLLNVFNFSEKGFNKLQKIPGLFFLFPTKKITNFS